MDVVVLGASGLLGSNVVATAIDRVDDVVGTYRSTEPDVAAPCYHCDLTEVGNGSDLLDDHEPDVVVNCAALTDVDDCERTPAAAQQVNADGPRRIAELCHQRGISFVHVSTDYVFDGKSHTPYAETHDPNPIQAYGRTKLEGERSVLDVAPSSLVVRLSFVYGTHRSTGDLTGFPAWVVSELQAGNDVPLFTDQYVTPSRAGQAATTLLDLVSAGERGLFHVASRSCVTPYQFGLEIASRMTTQGRLLKGSKDDIDRVAPRPEHTCLDSTKVERTLGRPQPTLQEDLDELEPFCI